MFCFGVRYRLVVFKICSNMLATKWYDRIVYINSFDYLVLISSLYNATSITVIPQTRLSMISSFMAIISLSYSIIILFQLPIQVSINHVVYQSFFFNSQYKYLLFTMIIRGNLFHFSFITLDKQSSTPSISLFPFTSIHIIDGAEPMSDVSHKVRMPDISFGMSTSPRANLHFGYL